jgi:hypothetical protein
MIKLNDELLKIAADLGNISLLRWFKNKVTDPLNKE